MASNPTIGEDIDKQFEHLINNLGHELENELDWTFYLRSNNADALHDLAEELMDEEFHADIQESVEEYDSKGNCTIGEPMLTIVRRAALTADEVKAIATQLEIAAMPHGVRLESVASFDPMDEDELTRWLDPEEATWRLRHFTDCGLEADAELPWAFLVLAEDESNLKKIGANLEENGFEEVIVYEERDEEGNYGLCAFLPGRNNEAELNQACEKIAAIANEDHGELGGVQFFTREDLENGDEE
jgi:Regulator of ribonuclease activity B